MKVSDNVKDAIKAIKREAERKDFEHAQCMWMQLPRIGEYTTPTSEQTTTYDTNNCSDSSCY